MIYRILADMVVVCHFGFIVFVVFGVLLVYRWRWISFLHIPAVIWGALIETFGWLCPLTHLEWYLLQAGGRMAYESDFINRYIIPVVYPEKLERGTQIVIGLIVIIINVLAYGWLLRTRNNNSSRTYKGRRKEI